VGFTAFRDDMVRADAPGRRFAMVDCVELAFFVAFLTVECFFSAVFFAA
jgi:hypothetical protein